MRKISNSRKNAKQTFSIIKTYDNLDLSQEDVKGIVLEDSKLVYDERRENKKHTEIYYSWKNAKHKESFRVSTR